MKVEEIQQLLIAYGLSEPEVKAFYHMAKMGEATATEVAKEAGLSRAEVYRAADGLEQRGLIERTMDRPQKFLPRRIEDVMERLLDAERRRVDELETQRETVVRHWPKPAGPEEADDERFQIQRGRAQIEGVLRRMLARAQRDVVIAAPHRTVNRLFQWGLADALADAVGRDVQVRLLTQITEDLLGDKSPVPDGIDLRHSEVPTYAQFLIIDQKEIAIYVTLDPVVGSTGRPETVLWLNSPDFTMGQQTLFDDLWMQSIGKEERRTELETGRHPHQMRVVRGRLPRFDEMRAMISRAERSVRLSFPDGDGDLERMRVLATISRVVGKGVDVRLLVEPASEAAKGTGAQVRAGALEPRFGLLIVDDAEALVVILDKADSGGEERGVVLTVPTAVRFLVETFEGQWATASG